MGGESIQSIRDGQSAPMQCQESKNLVGTKKIGGDHFFAKCRKKLRSMVGCIS